jgi:hypothetical protein
VEKSIKMVLAALRDQNLTTFSTGRGHLIDKHIKEILVVIRCKLPTDKKSLTAVGAVQSLLTSDQHLIDELSGLAPKWPGPGCPFPRNTEYPYEVVKGTWRAPASLGSFSRKEVKKYRNLAERVLPGAERALSAIKRSPPQ